MQASVADTGFLQGSSFSKVGLSPCVDLHNFINLSCMLMFGISHFEPCDQSHNLLLN